MPAETRTNLVSPCPATTGLRLWLSGDHPVPVGRPDATTATANVIITFLEVE